MRVLPKNEEILPAAREGCLFYRRMNKHGCLFYRRMKRSFAALWRAAYSTEE
ncbi:MAG: hypothetical protein ACPGWR_29955 [Ardenticatenaceae bacterium]